MKIMLSLIVIGCSAISAGCADHTGSSATNSAVDLKSLNTIAANRDTDLTLHFDRVSFAELQKIPLGLPCQVASTCLPLPTNFVQLSGPGTLTSSAAAVPVINNLHLYLTFDPSTPGGQNCLSVAQMAESNSLQLDIHGHGTLVQTVNYGGGTGSGSSGAATSLAGSNSPTVNVEPDVVSNMPMQADLVNTSQNPATIFVDAFVGIVIDQIDSCSLGAPSTVPPIVPSPAPVPL